MNFNLTMLNLWIGLCRGVEGLPKNIRNLGYIDKWIEWEFSTQNQEKVCPDLIVASEDLGHALLLEFKSGANTEQDQLRRYSLITQKDLITTAFISQKSSDRHDVLLLGEKEHGPRLKLGLVGYRFPLVLKDESGLSLSHNQFSIDQLNSLFSPRFEIDWPRIPSGFIPIDQDSELWEVAEVVVPKILHYMTERQPSIKVEQICQDICTTWSIMGKPAKDQFRVKVRDVLRKAGQHQFRSYLRWIKRIDSIEIINNPLDLKPDKRTSAYRNLRSAQKNFIESLKAGVSQLDFPF